eukprot:UN34675
MKYFCYKRSKLQEITDIMIRQNNQFMKGATAILKNATPEDNELENSGQLNLQNGNNENVYCVQNNRYQYKRKLEGPRHTTSKRIKIENEEQPKYRELDIIQTRNILELAVQNKR